MENQKQCNPGIGRQSRRKLRSRESDRGNNGREDSTAFMVWNRNQNGLVATAHSHACSGRPQREGGQEPQSLHVAGARPVLGCWAWGQERWGGPRFAYCWPVLTPPTAPTSSIKSGERKGPHCFQTILRMKTTLLFLFALTVATSPGKRLRLETGKGWVALSRYWTVSPRQAGPDWRSSNAGS